jgi:cystathionine gamma-synthase
MLQVTRANKICQERIFFSRHIVLCTQFSPFSSKGTKSQPSPTEAGRLAFLKRREINEYEKEIEKSSKISIDTMLSHAGLLTSFSANSQNQPLCPPIHMETTYTRPPSGDYNSTDEGGKGWVYARMGNPTRKLLEETLANLELSNLDKSSSLTTQYENDSIKNSTTCAFSSGMAAVGSIIMSLSHKTLHIILPDDVYHGTPTQLKTMFVEQGVTYSSVNMTDADDIKKEIDTINRERIDGNILIWMESPSNPLCKVTDIQEVCEMVKKIRSDNIFTIVDSTWAPPCITQPVRFSIQNRTFV